MRQLLTVEIIISHVGAWSPWVNTGLLIFAAFIAKYHRSFVTSVMASFKRLLSCFRNPTSREHRQIGLEKAESQRPRLAQMLRDLLCSIVTVGKRFHACTIQSARLVGGKYVRCKDFASEEWALLKDFWRDPDKAVQVSQSDID